MVISGASLEVDWKSQLDGYTREVTVCTVSASLELKEQLPNEVSVTVEISYNVVDMVINSFVFPVKIVSP